MKKINILVTTVGGLTSPDILKAYKDLDEYDVTIVGTDAFEFAVGKNLLMCLGFCLIVERMSLDLHKG